MKLRTCKNGNWTAGFNRRLISRLLVAATMSGLAVPATASDLLVAPTRVEFEGRTRSGEVILKNIGEKAATYRISLVLRRMNEDGIIEPIEDPSEAEALASEMIRYAPRRVTLEPGDPQAVRIAVRKPADLADGEYRVHMLFRAIPEAVPKDETASGDGLSITLRPIYGVTIPVIVRHGELVGSARLVDAKVADAIEGQMITVTLAREGERSTYGDFEVVADGQSDPIGVLRGVAIYPEVRDRVINVPLNAELPGGPVKLRYYEDDGDNRVLVDELVLASG